MVWVGHTHAHKTCPSDVWVEGFTYKIEEAAQALPVYLTSEPRNTAGIHRHTITVFGRPLRGRLSERPSCKSDLSLPRVRHLSACLMSRQAARSWHHGGARLGQSPTFVSTKSLPNPCFIGRAWPNFPAFYGAFRKKSQQNLHRLYIYRCLPRIMIL